MPLLNKIVRYGVENAEGRIAYQILDHEGEPLDMVIGAGTTTLPTQFGADGVLIDACTDIAPGNLDYEVVVEVPNGFQGYMVWYQYGTPLDVGEASSIEAVAVEPINQVSAYPGNKFALTVAASLGVDEDDNYDDWTWEAKNSDGSINPDVSLIGSLQRFSLPKEPAVAQYGKDGWVGGFFQFPADFVGEIEFYGSSSATTGVTAEVIPSSPFLVSSAGIGNTDTPIGGDVLEIGDVKQHNYQPDNWLAPTGTYKDFDEVLEDLFDAIQKYNQILADRNLTAAQKKRIVDIIAPKILDMKHACTKVVKQLWGVLPQMQRISEDEDVK